MRIAAFSAFCMDYYPQKDFLAPGGNSLNFSVQMKTLGADEVAVAGSIGTDTYGERIKYYLRSKQIDTTHLIQREGHTASNRLYLTEEGERYSREGEWINGVKDDGEFNEEDWNFLLGHDVIAVPYLDKYFEETLHRRTLRNTVVVDFMHFDNEALIAEHIHSVDLAFVSTSPSRIPPLRKLALDTGRSLILMLGREGSRAIIHGREYQQSANTSVEVIDTTGCGDAFQAAFVYYFMKGERVEVSLQKATEVATETMGRLGGSL